MRAYGLVAAGSAAGAIARVLVGWFAAPVLDDAWSTVAINVLGCLAIGVAAGVMASTAAMERWWPLVGPGALGGFTTFSAFVVLLDDLSAAEAAFVVVATLGLCPLAALLGEKAVTRGS